MTTLDDKLNELNKHHENVMSYIDESYKKSNSYIADTSAQINKLINSGKYKEGADLASKMMNGVEAHSNARWQQYAKFNETARKISETPITTFSSNASKNPLSLGISKGKLAAIVAGVAVVGGGIFLYKKHQQEKKESWVTRIEQERIKSGPIYRAREY